MNIFTDPFLYLGIAVWPISYFLWKFRFPSRLSEFKGFRVNARFVEMSFPSPANLLGPQKFYWSTYQLLSVVAIASWLYIMLFFTKFDQNIVMLRVANLASVSVFGTGHYVIWIAAFMVYLRYGAPFDFIKGIYGMAFFGAMHELLFYATYVSLYGAASSLYMNSPFLILISGMVFGFFLLYPKAMPRKKICLAFGGMVAFYFLWASAGFPVTLNIMTGHTIYFSNIQTNLLEDLSWLMPAFLFL